MIDLNKSALLARCVLCNDVIGYQNYIIKGDRVCPSCANNLPVCNTIIKLKLQNGEDREIICTALLKNGYKVWIDKVPQETTHLYHYYICIEREE